MFVRIMEPLPTDDNGNTRLAMDFDPGGEIVPLAEVMGFRIFFLVVMNHLSDVSETWSRLS